MIQWQKSEPGVYSSKCGRFTIEKRGSREWRVYHGFSTITVKQTLKGAKAEAEYARCKLEGKSTIGAALAGVCSD